MKQSQHPSIVASAQLLRAWVERRHFVWLYSADVLEEYRQVLAARNVRRDVIGRTVNMLRQKEERVQVGASLAVSPDPDDNRVCDCAEYGKADFIYHAESWRFSAEAPPRKGNLTARREAEMMELSLSAFTMRTYAGGRGRAEFLHLDTLSGPQPDSTTRVTVGHG